MKEILFVASVYDHLAAFHKPFITLFQEMGYTVHAAASPSMGRKEEIAKLGVVCHDVSFERSPVSLNNVKAVKTLKRLFSKHQFDLVHVHTPVAAFLTRMVLRKQKQAKVLYTAHGFHFYKGASKLNWLLYFNAEKISRKWTDGLIVMNQEDYSNALKLGYKKESLFLVHGVGAEVPPLEKDVKKIGLLKEELGILSDDVVISFVAELNENKNHQFLLSNWKVISRTCPNAKLLLIGKGKKEQELKNYVKDQCIDNVYFLGYRKDVSHLLDLSDIVTLLSKREGLPKSLMEAMSHSLPLVVTNIRGSRDLVKNGENGFVVSLGDDSALQKAFIDLLQESSLRSTMGNHSLRLVQPYLLPNVLKEYKLIYQTYLDSSYVKKDKN